jgi:hypothetical protein
MKHHFNNKHVKIWTCNEIWHFIHITKDREGISGPTRHDVTEEWKSLCYTLNIIRVIKSRIMKLVGHQSQHNTYLSMYGCMV